MGSLPANPFRFFVSLSNIESLVGGKGKLLLWLEATKAIGPTTSWWLRGDASMFYSAMFFGISGPKSFEDPFGYYLLGTSILSVYKGKLSNFGLILSTGAVGTVTTTWLLGYLNGVGATPWYTTPWGITGIALCSGLSAVAIYWQITPQKLRQAVEEGFKLREISELNYKKAIEEIDKFEKK